MHETWRLLGKSNMCEESAAVPLVMAGPKDDCGVCTMPVSLIDISETILDHFGLEAVGHRPGRSL